MPGARPVAPPRSRLRETKAFDPYVAALKERGESLLAEIAPRGDRELPVVLLEQLIQARLDEFEATGAGW